MFLMRFCIQLLLQVKFAVYDENFELSKNGRCFVMRIHMEVLLRMESGRLDHVKPCFDTAQFGSLYFGLMQNLNVNISSNSGGAPVIKFEQTP